VFLADFTKGLTAVLLAPWLAARLSAPLYSPDLFKLVAGVFVVVGNAFPFWLKFRGGKGVATSAGLLFGLIPAAALTVVVVWVIAFYTTRYVSLASVIAAAALPIAVYFITHIAGEPRPLILFGTIGLTTIVILRHRSNLSRLMRGTEQRFERREN
jgi:glycerol-3-phosphate acyltransferase PlsY